MDMESIVLDILEKHNFLFFSLLRIIEIPTNKGANSCILNILKTGNYDNKLLKSCIGHSIQPSNAGSV